MADTYAEDLRFAHELADAADDIGTAIVTNGLLHDVTLDLLR